MTTEYNKDQFETKRLIFRRFTKEDGDAIYALSSDPDFMQYLRRHETREKSDWWIEHVSSYWKYNAGFWAVVFKETNETIGWCGTWSQLEFEIGKMEIGYAIAKKYGGKGLATEAAKFALNYTFAVRGADKVYALATPENIASHRIMEKLGMRKEGQQLFASYNLEMVYYAITKEELEHNLFGATSVQNRELYC